MNSADRIPGLSDLPDIRSARFDPENAGRDESGACYVSLAMPAEALLRYVSSLTGALQLTGSPVAVLATTAPAVFEWRPGDGPLPADDRARSFLNLAEFAFVRAVREKGCRGARWLLEIHDARNCPGRQWVIPEGEEASFLDFARTFQCRRDLPTTWFSPNQAGSAGRLRTLTQRISWLRQLHERGASALVRPLSPVRVEATLPRAAHEGQPLRATVYNRSGIQGAVWTPEASMFDDRSGTAGERIARFRGDGVGLELDSAAVASAWLWSGQCACCNEEKCAVEMADENDELAFAIRAPEGTDESEWRDFLQPLLEG